MKASPQWHITRLEELAKVERGRFSHRPRNDPSFYGGSTPFIQTGDVSGAKSGFIRGFSQTLNEKGLSVSKVFPKGTLMVSIAANIGDAAELGFDSACPDSVIAITPGRTLCSKYLRYYLRSRQSWIQYLAPSGTQRNINVEFLEDVEIEYPPLPEQRKIADILSTWDEALETLDALIATKTRQKQALMQQLLTGKTRVKGAKGKWKKLQLGELAENRSDQNKGKLGTELLYGVTKADGVVPMRDHVKGESFHRCKLLEHDWFAYNPMRINIGSIARWQGNKTVMVSGDYVVFRCFDDRLSPAYLDQLRQSWMWQSFVTQGGNGSVRIRIYFSDLAEFTFPCPPLAEQQQIAAILDTADQELTLLRTQRQTLDQQKRGLMQRLLTGKVRVKVQK